MSHTQQITAFSKDVHALIDRYASEFHLPVASAIGVLELAKLDLYKREAIDHHPPSNDRDFGDDGPFSV